MSTPRPVTELRVSPPNARPFTLYCYSDKLASKLEKYPGAVVVGETTTPPDGIIPTHVGKTARQEQAEKAAARLVSRNQQAAANRCKKAKAVRPAPAVTPAPVPAKATKPGKRGFTEVNAQPIVCLTTQKYYRSMSVAEHKTGIKRTLLCYLFGTRPAPISYKGHVYDYATDYEHKTKRCKRSVKGLASLPEEPRRGRSPTPKKALLVIETGVVYRTTGELAKNLHISKRWINRLGDDEVRQTPVGAVRRATADEVAQWKQKNGK